ncbi:EAL domain-containing protein [Blastococcus sp. TML/M2B]|uniref:putative bifunctional diguanylate cyclase/phosphodiesterase n=1 Tax=unclassified Blastococcus TaxID=2619396 RepID=UPI00190CF89C|nr:MULTISPECIES: EAL domain-containing protein [unclassified Blastococcus]MBN1091203.1 EAL domain-containing protein [Blastococcus sp. TML/M2B]MBN1095242.1 EAL domain-containing protein [Blastococcus sp. TML/C7B]
MRIQERAARRRRGTPLWVYLTALVLVPLVGVLALTGAIVRVAVTEAASAARSESAIAALGGLHSARSAIIREIIPTLTQVIVGTPNSASALLGEDSDIVVDLREPARQLLQDTRAATNEALAAIPESSLAAAETAAAIRRIGWVRAAADAPGADPESIYDDFLELADDLAGAQARAARAARAELAPVATTDAVRDVQLVADAATIAGRLVPEFIGTQLVGVAMDDREAWRADWALYTAARDNMAKLSQDRLERSWRALASSPEVAVIDQLLAAHAAGEAAILSVPQLISLVDQATARDARLSDLLADAAAEAQSLAVADHRAANDRRDLLLSVGLVLVVASLAGAVVVGRIVSRALGALAHQAEKISHGQLVEISDRGPREARTVSAALATTVAGLSRIQAQAAAVTRGDLADPVLADALPGPLGELLHASVEKLVASVRERESLQTALAHQAAHDPLTDLPNRIQARTLTAAALHRGRRAGTMTGLLFVDLDGFKGVNDRFGHATGDALLRIVADRLRVALRPGDVVCRLGGDEFVVLVEQVTGERELLELARRLIDTVSHPAVEGGQELRIGASVGIAVAQDASVDADVLFAEADAAAYRAKARGRGRAELFDESLRAQLAAQSELETALTAGLAAGELEVHYQPVVGLASGRLEGYEALLRWNRPGVGMVPPNDFIPVAETSKLICDLDRWVLHEATRQVAAWRAEHPAAELLTVAVNVSGRHLSDSRVVQDVVDALAASGLPPELLVVEVTETVLVNDPAAFGHLVALRDLGVSVAIDDFGTGYTSIGQLAGMPVDTLKIDRSFVASADSGHAELVELMIRAAHTFRLSVVAEGVEEEAQLAWLRDQRCDFAQGYLLSRPLPAAAARDAWREALVPSS